MSRCLSFLTRLSCSAAVVLALTPAFATAQSPTGTLSGRVYDQNGGAIAGAKVTLESPGLQGTSHTTTSENGDYIFKFLPPGRYTATFERQGFATSRESVTVAPTEAVELSFTMKAASVQESVTVTADSPTFVNSVESATSFKKTLVESLPTSRSLLSYVNLAPAVHGTGPNGNLSISGAMSFDNLFLLNGAVIQDNIRAEPLDLYIEDAIQEVTTANSGISAEYGRFQGGVVTAVTRSGGNTFSGSYRAGFDNDNWRTRTPFGEPKLDKTIPTHEFTFGGPLVKDRLWFFAAGRVFDRTLAEQTAETAIPYERNQTQQRFEGKATARLSDRQRLQVGYMQIGQTTKNSATATIGSDAMDLASLVTRTDPQSLFTANYTTSIGQNFFIESQYSRRYSAIQHAGGTNTDQILGTPIFDQGTGFSFWAPGYCGVCGDEQRSNDDFYAKGSYFLSRKAGSHHMVFGVDTFNDRLKGENAQAASDYWVYATGSVVDGTTIYPVIANGFSTLIIYWPIKEKSRGTNFRTNSLFYQDTWTVNRHLTVDLGVRDDMNNSRDSVNNLVSNSSLVSPRLGIIYDPVGDGKTTFNASYGRYAAALANPIANSASPGGIPETKVYVYEGPEVNTDPNAPLVPTAQALKTVFDWFNANASNDLLIQNTIPGVLTQIRGDLKSPHSDDYTAGVSRLIGTHGALRFDVVHRAFHDFYAERTDLNTGEVTDDEGQPGDLTLVENTNALARTYNAFNAQGTYRIGTRLDMGASYTLSELKGNIDGEDLNTGPVPAGILSYPEYFDVAWSNPKGDLSSDQRHRVRVWANVVLPVGGKSDTLSLGAIEEIESGTPYGASAIISLIGPNDEEYVTNPGYVTPPQEAVYNFGPRDEFRTAAMYRTDLSINYNRRLSTANHAEAFVQFALLNLFNQFQAFNDGAGEIDTTILTSKTTDSLVPFNPFTDTPVRGVNWDYGKNFGKPVSAAAYTLPRTFRFSVGVRF